MISQDNIYGLSDLNNARQRTRIRITVKAEIYWYFFKEWLTNDFAQITAIGNNAKVIS